MKRKEEKGEKEKMKIKRGDILYADLDPVIGSEQGRKRPVLVIQNDLGNMYSPTIVIFPITSKIYIKKHFTNIEIRKGETGLSRDSTILLNQIKVIDKRRVMKKIGSLNLLDMERVEKALLISFGMEKDL